MLPVSRKNIVLTGFMAAGKSVAGKRLARRLKRSFVDLDQAIEAREGIKVKELFSRRGEAYFRKVEKETLREVLGREGQVIATGGGAVMDAENLSLLRKKSVLIYLAARPSTLLQRSGSGDERPLLSGRDRLKRIEELLTRRAEIYSQAHITINTERLSVGQVVDKMMEALAQGIGRGKIESE